jgi:hypothetical protein
MKIIVLCNFDEDAINSMYTKVDTKNMSKEMVIRIVLPERQDIRILCTKIKGLCPSLMQIAGDFDSSRQQLRSSIMHSWTI